MKLIIALLALLAIANCFETLTLQASYHYEDPWFSNHSEFGVCTGSKEKSMDYDGLDQYRACMPATFGPQNLCYADTPPGTTATPMPIYYGEDGIPRCALVCSGAATGICGPRSQCMILPGVSQAQVGVCLYKKK